MATVKPRRWFVPRYSLRTLLVMMTVVCLVSGFWLNKAFRQRDAVRRFYQLTGNRQADICIPPTVAYRLGTEHFHKPTIPPWLYPLRDVIGEEAFGEVTAVQLLSTPTADEDLRYLADVPRIERLLLGGTKVTDKGMPRLHACPKLRFLSLDNTAITDEGVSQLTVLTELESLSLNGTKVTDKGLEPVAELTKLKELWLRRTAITGSGYRKLQAALPNCKIHVDLSAIVTVHP